MSRTTSAAIGSVGYVPRASGDEPLEGNRNSEVRACSPRERG